MRTVVAAVMGILLLAFVSVQTIVEVKHTPPSTIPPEPGAEGVVTIYKGALRGYAKLELEFPDEVEVEVLDPAGGAATFTDHTMKVIWISLPPAEVITIKYKATATKKAKGTGKIKGKFIYVDAGERKIADIPPLDVNLGEGPLVEKKEEIPPEISIERQIYRITEKEYRVVISMKKRGISGFARIAEELPEGVTSKAEDIKGASFTQVGNSVKIVWMNIPEDEELKVSYIISSEKEIPFGDISGTFSYLYKEEITNVDIQTTKFPEVLVQRYEKEFEALPEGEGPKPVVEPKPVVGEPSTVTVPGQQRELHPQEPQQMPQQITEPEKPPITEEKPSEAEQPITKGKEEEKEPPQPEKKQPAQEQPPEQLVAETKEERPQTPTPSQNIRYSVQVCALKMARRSPRFVARAFNFPEPLRFEEHEGWFKYTIEEYFREYAQARNKREELKGSYTFPGPFVVAYMNGRRITVQEALMITGQKWVP